MGPELDEVKQVLEQAEQMATANEYRVYLTKAQLDLLLELIDEAEDV